MIGILVQLAVSWLIIWLLEKQHLTVLGFLPTKLRLFDFSCFLLLAAGCCASGFLLRMWWGHEKWTINPLLNGSLVWQGALYNIRSVLFEELIFRGVLFYILIRRLGTGKAIILSAVAFGIYHWFSYGLFWNIPQMAMYFFITGIMGLIYAYAYAKTFSLYIPIALHFGWNFTQSVVFSGANIGKGILVLAKAQTPVTVSMTAYAIILIFPLLSIWGINYWLLKRKPQASMPGAAVSTAQTTR